MFPSPCRLSGCRGIPAIALLIAASVAQAQGPAPQAMRNERADPLDAQARVPAATHTSSLANYRRLGDDKRIDWKEANEAVNRIGGWRAYAREAQQPDPTPPATAPGTVPAAKPTPAPAPASGVAPGHRGHQMHRGE